MKIELGRWLVGYGVFLILIGLVGYLSNPEKARTALMSGGVFGALSIACGVLWLRGMRWARKAALGITGLLTLIFAWRATVGWLAVAQGNADKLTTAVLISLMLLATVATIARLLRREVPV
ncbi:MAG: hypothetical protein PCFJNLEI_00595 [Verrucomicrobiae bacterium]|nr:hypothetical protein [Verrucomicrobiae bacterium]